MCSYTAIVKVKDFGSINVPDAAILLECLGNGVIEEWHN